jgi:hypothetical protein
MSLLADTGDGPKCEEDIVILSADVKSATTRDDVLKGLYCLRCFIRVQL